MSRRLVGCANLLGKATLGVLVMMWIRWTLPRLRIDQVMTTCLKYCTPIAAVLFAGVLVWQLVLPGGLVRGLPHWLSRPAGEIREGWLEGPGGLPARRAGAKPAAKGRKLNFKEQRELDGMEAAIHTAEAGIAEREARFLEPDFHRKHGSRVAELTAEIESEKRKVAKLYSRWEELEALKG
jgi:hypothetical protein